LHCEWQSRNTQTSGDLQSEFKEHGLASPTGVSSSSEHAYTLPRTAATTNAANGRVFELFILTSYALAPLSPERAAE
jgi:hypothetical protein